MTQENQEPPDAHPFIVIGMARWRANIRTKAVRLLARCDSVSWLVAIERLKIPPAVEYVRDFDGIGCNAVGHDRAPLEWNGPNTFGEIITWRATQRYITDAAAAITKALDKGACNVGRSAHIPNEAINVFQIVYGFGSIDNLNAAHR